MVAQVIAVDHPEQVVRGRRLLGGVADHTQELIAAGVPSNRVRVTAKGEDQPAEPGSSAEALAKNRRVELKVLNQ